MLKELEPLKNWKGTNLVVDTGWGDGGKGKVVDVLSQRARLVVRFNGGPNAGHTVENNFGEFKLHLVPSGIFSPDTISILASTVAINPFSLVEELSQLKEKGVPFSSDNLLVSKDAHLIMPWHILRDKLKEKARGGSKIGTTGQGIGPLYADRAERTGLKVRDLLDPNFEKIFDREFVWQQKLINTMQGGDKNPASLDRDEIIQKLAVVREVIAPLITNVLPVIHEAYYSDKNILGEGAQGALLDLDLGGYPYVTSSNTGLPGFLKTVGGFVEVKRVVGVTKAYQTRVGEGPMPTELTDEIGEQIRKKGIEFGATTGRPRRCGWIDVPAVNYGIRASGTNSLAITKLDVLDDFDKIMICIAYEVDGRCYKSLPDADPEFMSQAKPIYKTVAGWQRETTKIRTFEELPSRAREYIKNIEELTGKPVEFVSNGPHRNQSIFK